MTDEYTPIMDWDSEEGWAKGVIWWARLDNRFQIEVQGLDEETHRGIFLIFDHNNDNKLVFSEEVPVSYGAIFGPDVSDIAYWQNKVIEVVDGIYG